MEEEAQAHCKGDAADPSGQAFLSEQSGNSKYGECADIIKKDAVSEHGGGESPAEETIHDALRELEQGIHEGYGKS